MRFDNAAPENAPKRRRVRGANYRENSEARLAGIRLQEELSIVPVYAGHRCDNAATLAAQQIICAAPVACGEHGLNSFRA